MKYKAKNALLEVVGLLLFATLRADASTTVTLNGSACPVDAVITRDVCVIGGGASGTYAAIRLSDLGKSVVVVEQQDRLGGHTQTYTDPVTGGHIDYGVEDWHNLPVVLDFFARLNVSLVTQSNSVYGTSQYYDFSTGKSVPGYSAGDPTPGLTAYAAQLAANYSYLEEGFGGIPYPVPSDLLLPFGEFVIKYSLQSVVSLIFSVSQGLGNLLAQPTLYVFKSFGLGIIQGFEEGYLTTAANDNSLLYEHAYAELEPNVLLNSTILLVNRSSPNEANVLVSNPSGQTLLKCGKLVFAIPPKLNNLEGWDLSLSELSLFGQFTNSAYYTAIVRNSGLPSNITFVNVSPNTIYQIPKLPGIYEISPTGITGLLNVKFGSSQTLPDSEVQQQILSTIANLQVAGKTPGVPSLAVYSSHAPFELAVSPSAIAAGFYKELYALQGQRNTYYTGAAFHTQDSSLLWQFTEALLPSITDS
ncbi:hypothetical protein G7Y89_g11980 [Cudoniella acicularis]|uniref:Amine oxidase n=1 Tax=Cudoniella acicularis TaxID=354080 RepID=A0A8H4RC37_9HELO|nr:hypothetical protein G7Y89_g11980 [Cudoniella acicularis]